MTKELSTEEYARRWERGRLIMTLIVTVIICIPLFITFSLPIPIDDEVRELHNWVEALPAGSTCVMYYEVAMVEYQEVHAWYLTREMLKKNCKVIALAGGTDGIWYHVLKGFPDAGIKPWNDDKTVAYIDGVEKRYGIDFVNLGMLGATTDAAYLLFLRDIWASCPADWYGNKVQNLPIMQNIKSVKDIAFLATMTSSEERWVRSFGVAGYPLKLIDIGKGGQLAIAKSYKQAGNILGYVCGYEPAQYEILCGTPGYAVQIQNAMGLMLMFTVGIIVLGNIRSYIPSLPEWLTVGERKKVEMK